jgi:hypothetical protein
MAGQARFLYPAPPERTAIPGRAGWALLDHYVLIHFDSGPHDC